MTNIPPAVWRQTLLRTLKVSQTAIAKKAKVPESTVSRVLANTYWSATAKGQAKRDLVRRVTAELLGVRVADIFPADEKPAAPPAKQPAKKKGAKR